MVATNLRLYATNCLNDPVCFKATGQGMNTVPRNNSQRNKFSLSDEVVAGPYKSTVGNGGPFVVNSRDKRKRLTYVTIGPEHQAALVPPQRINLRSSKLKADNLFSPKKALLRPSDVKQPHLLPRFSSALQASQDDIGVPNSIEDARAMLGLRASTPFADNRAVKRASTPTTNFRRHSHTKYDGGANASPRHQRMSSLGHKYGENDERRGPLYGERASTPTNTAGAALIDEFGGQGQHLNDAGGVGVQGRVISKSKFGLATTAPFSEGYDPRELAIAMHISKYSEDPNMDVMDLLQGTPRAQATPPPAVSQGAHGGTSKLFTRVSYTNMYSNMLKGLAPRRFRNAQNLYSSGPVDKEVASRVRAHMMSNAGPRRIHNSDDIAKFIEEKILDELDKRKANIIGDKKSSPKPAPSTTKKKNVFMEVEGVGQKDPLDEAVSDGDSSGKETEDSPGEDPPVQDQQKEPLLAQTICRKPAAVIAELPKNGKACVYYKYIVTPGNNSKVVSTAMKRRTSWMTTANYDTTFNFMWTQNMKGIRFSQVHKSTIKQIVNHFEHNWELTTKSGLLRNMKTYCNKLGVNVFNYMPACFQVKKASSDQMEEFATVFRHLEKKAEVDRLARLKGLKDGVEPAPKSKKKKNSSKSANPGVAADLSVQNVWIIKPASWNRGRGIQVSKDYDEIVDIITNDGDPSTSWIIQKYIERPLLIHKRKFDIRVFALLNQDLEIYYYTKAYVRTSSIAYSLDDLKDRYIHLTNDAIQQKGEAYGEHEEGNKMSLEELQAYLDAHVPEAGAADWSVDKDLVPTMKDMVYNSINSVMDVINPNKYTNCFEIFGYDFMIDQDFNVWLIEVNSNPCLEFSCPMLTDYITSMIDDAMKLTIDKWFVSKKKTRSASTSFVKIEQKPHPALNKPKRT